MADIFISYSSKDKPKALELCKKLSSDGYSCWIDESGIDAAAKWSNEIVRAIEGCIVFIILLSRESLKSHNVIKELSLASEEKKHIIPITIEPVKLSHDVKYQLAGLQHVAFENFERIESAVIRFVGEPIGGSEQTKRHLLAVMFTDIKGYSKMMNTDESLAMDILRFHNNFMRQRIERNDGRVVEIIGDAFLAVFESAVRAVETGMTIQEGLHQHNEERPEQERFHVRIGIHMGDIIEEAGGVKGDTVNIAARIQAIAPGGGVAISETVYDAVKHKMPLSAVSLGQRQLKNIKEPYTIYALKQVDSQIPVGRTLSPSAETDGLRVRPTGEPAIDKLKRLAVIPFDDLSAAHDNEAFSDGLSDELISTLNKLDQVFVLDRQTSKMYKGVKMTAKQIAEELEVRYIITGGVRKQEKDIRVQATLIDTETGRTLWDEKFSGTMDDIFAIQEKTAKDIAAGLKLQLTPEEHKRIEKKLTENAEAYELYLKANVFYDRHTKQDFQYALQLSETAVKLDPSFAAAYALISQLYLELYRLYDRRKQSLEHAEEAALKALDLDPELPQVYQALSELSLQKGSSDEAIMYAKKEGEVGAMTASGYAHLGFIYMETDRPLEAASYYEQSLQLSMNNLTIHSNLCLQYERLGDSEKLCNAAIRALPYYERHLRNHPDDQTQRMSYAILLEYCGNREKSLSETEMIADFPYADGSTLYNSACIFIRNSRIDQGLHVLERAVDAGFAAADFHTDPDLNPVREMPEFQALMKKLEKRINKKTA